uniref:Cell shape-determining protein MreC n=1 Tax=uncultured Alphaproteobacteria bacterium TaxID=91750 RepID=A0A6M4NQZ9_9PROT|nr:cell shape-determining protein MreC [uncultured Alphaproteobacteria bacterium]
MVRKRRVVFLHFSHLRRTVKKFAIVLLFIVVFAFMLLNKTNNALIEKTSTTAGEIISPVTEILVLPASLMLDGYDYLRSLRKIDEENQLLRTENRRLIIANAKNRALETENRILSEMLNYVVPPEADFITAKVVAEEGSAFAHSLTVYIGGSANVKKGQVVLSNKGVIGRVEEAGARYAKIALINNINSRISVMVEDSRIRGMMVGQNDIWPDLVFLPLDAKINVGDKIITSGIGGVFPVGLPVGTVASIDKNNIKIKPANDLSRLEYVMIVDYKLPDPADEIYGDGRR